jgi:hypothetical protein
MSDWADEEAVLAYWPGRLLETEQEKEHHCRTRERIATALRAAERRGHIAGLREAADLCVSHDGEGDPDFVAFVLRRRAKELEASE